MCDNSLDKFDSYNGVAWGAIALAALTISLKRMLTLRNQWRLYTFMSFAMAAVAAVLYGPILRSAECSTSQFLYPYLFIILGSCFAGYAISVRRRLSLGSGTYESLHNNTFDSNNVEVPPSYQSSMQDAEAQPLIAAIDDDHNLQDSSHIPDVSAYEPTPSPSYGPPPYQITPTTTTNAIDTTTPPPPPPSLYESHPTPEAPTLNNSNIPVAALSRY